ncbi:MAG: serine/threonine protein kinase [Burkholderiales bacterium]|nr:serine/threonine protein kinase [Burkholderiales bacterium]
MTLKKLGRYEVIRVLGKGAMGVVYEGRDPNLDRRVAIKTVKVENLSEEAASEYEHRFRTEARSAARLQHPNIVSVYDSDRDGDVAFLVMEYIQGDDLKHHLDRGTRYSLEQSLKIVRDLLSALDYAHRQGIVHRDIKPANLLIEPGGRVKLTDFGVARIQDSGEATRTQGSMVGTLKYMAPEQVQGQKIDSRADLFSAGVMLYQLLTDKRPFDGDNDFSIIHQIIGHHPPPPSSINPKLPSALDAVVARALAKTREERFATARDFAVALQAATRRAEDPTVVPPADPSRGPESASRPLTRPGTVPPGSMSQPSAGSTSVVTQEAELVYWKDVKESTDAEELQGFLERFPAGIYADLARRRLRKLAGEGSGSQPGTVSGGSTILSTASVFPSAQFADGEATRASADPSRPGTPAEAAALQPAQWVDEEYTRTIVQASILEPLRAAAAAAAATAAPGAAAPATPVAPVAPVAPATGAAAADSTFPQTQVMGHDEEPSSGRASKPAADEGQSMPPLPAKKKRLPVAVLAGVGVLAVAGVLAAMLMRGGQPDGTAAPADAPVATAPAAPAARGPAPADMSPQAPHGVAPAAVAGAAAMPPDTPVTATEPHKPVAEPHKAAPVKKAPVTRTAKASPPVTAPEPVRASATEPAAADAAPAPPKAAPQAVAAGSGGFAAVEACRGKFFLARELCLTEACAKPGAGGHPLCVKHREEARLREESRVRQGPQ